MHELGLSVLGLCRLAGPAQADPAGVDANLDTLLVRPSARSGRLISRGGPTLEGNRLEAAAWLQFERAPLVRAGPHGIESEVVPFRSSVQLASALTLGTSVALEAAVVLAYSSFDAPLLDAPNFGVGDTHLSAIWNPGFTSALLDVAMTFDLWLPTSTSHALIGEQAVRGGPGLLAELTVDPIAVLGSVGVLLRPSVETGEGLEVGHELLCMLGAATSNRETPVRWMAEVHARVGLRSGFAPGALPIHLISGLELRALGSPFSVNVVLGTSLSDGYGAADLRGLIGIRFRGFDAGEASDASPSEPAASAPDSRRRSEAQLRRLLELPPELIPVEAPSDPLASCRVLGAPIRFQKGSSELDGEARGHLAGIIETLHSQPSLLEVTIEGYASVEGSSDSNWVLAERRAREVLRYLVEAGVSARRLSMRGLGELDAHEVGAVVATAEERRRVRLCITRELDAFEDVPSWALEPTSAPWHDRGTEGEARE